MPTGLGLLARQFGRPSGPAGRLVTRLLARSNAPFNRWVVDQLAGVVPAPRSIIELGCGPGVGLAHLLDTYPQAQIVGVDPSDVVLSAARRRNATAIDDGRLILITGDVTDTEAYQPADLVLAVHVLYFWLNPVGELECLRNALAPTGRVALGYQLRGNMPRLAQENFPKQGFILYGSDADVATVLQQAGFGEPEIRILGDPARPGGRLAIAAPTSSR